MSRPASLLPTYLLCIADDVSGALTFAETDVGTTFKTTARDLAGGHVPSGFILSRVFRLDAESGLMTDVTRSVLLEVIRLCRELAWGTSPKLDAALTRCRLAPVLIVEATSVPAHPADTARADEALVSRAHARGAAILTNAEAA